MNVFILIFVLIITVSCVYSEGEDLSLDEEYEIVKQLGYNVVYKCDNNISCENVNNSIHITSM